MPDDILDAAQKAINDAATAGGSSVAPASSEPTAPPSEPEPLPMTPPPAPLPPEPTTAAPEPTPVPTPPPPADVPVDPAKTATVNEILNGSAPESTIVPPIKSSKPSGTGKPKKRFSGTLIAVIVTLLLALPVGVYFISQQNEQIARIRSKATGNTYACQHTSDCPSGWFCNTNSFTCQQSSGGTYACDFTDPNACGGDRTLCHCTGGNACTGSECVPPTYPANVCTSQGRSWCTNVYGSGMTCCVAGYTCCQNSNGCCQGTTHNTQPPGSPPPDTATPTTPNTPVCQNIKLYKGGTQVTDFHTLQAGDDVVLAVKGNLAPTKAHFRINGKKLSDPTTAGWDETTTQNASNEFTIAYTIPDNVTDFVIEGEVFTNGAWH